MEKMKNIKNWQVRVQSNVHWSHQTTCDKGLEALALAADYHYKKGTPQWADKVNANLV